MCWACTLATPARLAATALASSCTPAVLSRACSQVRRVHLQPVQTYHYLGTQATQIAAAGHSTFLSAGDAVFGLAHGCLGTAVVSPAAMLAPLPATLSFQEAATTPTVFITGEQFRPLCLLREPAMC